MTPASHRLGELTADDLAAAFRAGRWVLLPFGAVEAHGPQLPLATDLIQAEHVATAVAERLGGLVAPGMPYAVCRTMRNFPGTVSLSVATFQALVREVVAEYVRHGARKLCLYSGHAEPAQLEALREAVVPLVDADPGLTILAIGPYAFVDHIRREAGLVGQDGHAVSTAITSGSHERYPSARPATTRWPARGARRRTVECAARSAAWTTTRQRVTRGLTIRCPPHRCA